jgi:hypothetical protein
MEALLRNAKQIQVPGYIDNYLTASLNVERRGHTATQLQDGEILVVIRENGNGAVSDAEVFDAGTRWKRNSTAAFRSRNP